MSGSTIAGSESSTPENMGGPEEERVPVDDARRPGWHWAHHEIIDLYGPKLGPYSLAIYYALVRHAGPDRRCWPSYSTLAREAGMSRRKAIDAVNLLLELGLIKKMCRTDSKGDQTSNLYILVDAGKIEGDGASGAPPVVNAVHHPSASSAPKRETSKKNHKEEENDDQVSKLLERIRYGSQADREELLQRRGGPWIRAAIREAREHRARNIGAYVRALDQGDWQPQEAPPPDCEEVRYRYIRGEYAAYIAH